MSKYKRPHVPLYPDPDTPPSPPRETGNPYEKLKNPPNVTAPAVHEGVELEDIDKMLSGSPAGGLKGLPETSTLIEDIEKELEEAPLITNAVATPVTMSSPALRGQDGIRVSARETAVLIRGGTLPQTPIKDGTDPLLVESMNLFEKLMCGGVIMPWATTAYGEVSNLIVRIREQIRDE